MTDRSFAIQIDDGGAVNNLASATATVTIGTVNHAPTTADASPSGAEDGGAIAITLSGGATLTGRWHRSRSSACQMNGSVIH